MMKIIDYLKRGFIYITLLVSLIVGGETILLAIAQKAQGEIVSQKEAKRIARLFFNDAYSKVCDDPEYVYNGKRLTTDRLFTPFYVFNSPEGGFVIISADNKAFPILGYSLSRPGFPKSGPGEEELILLRNFARDIELIRFDSRYPTEAAAAWETIPQTIHEILYSDAILAPDFVRHRPDDSSLWVMRGRAVEFPYEWPKTDEEIRIERELAEEAEKEEEPFAFHEEFIQWIAETRAARDMELEERLHPTRPIVKSLGGAHFTIESPTPVSIVNIYNAEGALVKRIYFPDATSLAMDISNLPRGFYFAHLLSSGNAPYGIRLWR